MSDLLPTTFDVGVTTITNVDAISRIGFDLRDMGENLEKNDFLNARRIYDSGKYSNLYDRYGNELEGLRTLQSLSLDAATGQFDEHPTYLFQLDGLTDAGQSIPDAVTKYATHADRFVQEMLADDTNGILAAEAAAILSVGLFASGRLWDAVSDCVAIGDGYNPAADEAASVAGGRVVDPRRSLDEFLALWIGAGQDAAPDFDGNLLYAQAQRAAEQFGTDSESRGGEAEVNWEVKRLYMRAQSRLSAEKHCRSGFGGGGGGIGGTDNEDARFLWSIANRVMALSHVPLVQMLLYNMFRDHVVHVRMYALAIVPQISQCRPSVHRKLKSYLLDKPYDGANRDRIVKLLNQAYECLGMTCRDVGKITSDEDGVMPECVEYRTGQAIAQFLPIAESRELATIDLDILAIRKLLKYPSTTNNLMARMYYAHGRAAIVDRKSSPISSSAYATDDTLPTLSLREMARSEEVLPSGPYRSDYYYFHDNEVHYADTQIAEAFAGEGKWGSKSSGQRAAYIISTLRYGVVVEYLMGLLGRSAQSCRDRTETVENSSTLDWDGVAALYIGSLEGTEQGGSDDAFDGMQLWNLANKRSAQFNTVNDDRYSIVNGEVENLLYAGQAHLVAGDCPNFQKSIGRLLHLLFVPLLQSTIWYAILNESRISNSDSEDLPVGEVIALSVLPVVARYDSVAADTILENMIVEPSSTLVRDGPQAVANAVFQVLDDVGWGCEYVGQANGVDACELYVPVGMRNDEVRSSATGSSVSPFALALAMTLFVAGTILFSL